MTGFSMFIMSGVNCTENLLRMSKYNVTDSTVAAVVYVLITLVLALLLSKLF